MPNVTQESEPIFTAADWREHALKLAGQVFDLQITIIALRRQLGEMEAKAAELEVAAPDEPAE